MPDESVDARVIIRANAPGFNSRPGIVARLAPTWEVLEQLIEQACDLCDWIALLWAASGEAPAKERLANVNYRRALLPISECKNVFWTRVNSGISAMPAHLSLGARSHTGGPHGLCQSRLVPRFARIHITHVAPDRSIRSYFEAIRMFMCNPRGGLNALHARQLLSPG